MGRGSKIFIIAFLISALVFGLAGFAVVSAITNLTAPAADPAALSEGAVRRPASSVGAQSFNLLVINVDYRPETYSYDRAKVTGLFGDAFGYSDGGRRKEISLLSAVLVRVDREREEFTFTPISANALTADGKQTLSALYCEKGISALLDQVWYLTGITVDKHAVLNPTSAEKLTDLIGGFEYSVISSVSAEDEISVQSGKQTLTGKKVRTMLLCEYSGGSSTRESVAAELLKLFLDKVTTEGEQGIKEIFGEAEKFVQTNLDAEFISKSASLIAKYQSFGKKELALVGEYSGGHFVTDINATVDRFSNYRKYYG